MPNTTTLPPRATAREIPKDQWGVFLAEFTRENRGAHARVEVMGEGSGRQVQVEGRPLDGVSVDYKDGEDTVWIAFGSAMGEHITHGVVDVSAIRTRPPVGNMGAVLEIEANDGTRTLLQLSWPEEYALPPGEEK